MTVADYFLNKLYWVLQVLKHKFEPAYNVNLLGDRDIEWSWVASQIPPGPGEALDFGSGKSPLPLICARRGYNVIALDLQPIQLPYVHPRRYSEIPSATGTLRLGNQLLNSRTCWTCW